ncbi:MAG: hypothetical protein BRD21_02475 [Halobacteriales archaeon SW_8_66_22]|nr:MAG: hypothetical protein BRD21_02475 [Halobacteriales archaeon SW_8_66_22]
MKRRSDDDHTKRSDEYDAECDRPWLWEPRHVRRKAVESARTGDGCEASDHVGAGVPARVPGIAEQALGYVLTFARRIHEGLRRQDRGDQ